jgi:hypothetical protein
MSVSSSCSYTRVIIYIAMRHFLYITLLATASLSSQDSFMTIIPPYEPGYGISQDVMEMPDGSLRVVNIVQNGVSAYPNGGVPYITQLDKRGLLIRNSELVSPRYDSLRLVDPQFLQDAKGQRYIIGVKKTPPRTDSLWIASIDEQFTISSSTTLRLGDPFTLLNVINFKPIIENDTIFVIGSVHSATGRRTLFTSSISLVDKPKLVAYSLEAISFGFPSNLLRHNEGWIAWYNHLSHRYTLSKVVDR